MDKSIDRSEFDNTRSTGFYEGTEKDWLIAVEKKAANGDPLFTAVMDFLCYNGYADVPKDQQEAVTWWQKAADCSAGGTAPGQADTNRAVRVAILALDVSDEVQSLVPL